MFLNVKIRIQRVECKDWLLPGAHSNAPRALLCDSGPCVKYVSFFGRREFCISSLLRRKTKKETKNQINIQICCAESPCFSSGSGVYRGLDDTKEPLWWVATLTVRPSRLPQLQCRGMWPSAGCWGGLLRKELRRLQGAKGFVTLLLQKQ